METLIWVTKNSGTPLRSGEEHPASIARMDTMQTIDFV
ncbi:hypothetical protein SJ05684_a41090 (plasmid) [Sinorhizobium sojae CCBAU 05684]|uniref:Uncharacterized protein n=1 Tax=Sinorhizobium sojae CCBAU 05684 TaxID=716928 RepID=A0A249PNZ9_9HYPH|nr:hypothetical protein SJ05684_a41090 [Sinorhizobium sojae CCBAU 05684]AWM30068.1 hypothetical protein AOX55_00004634 [Sinorhizobium fredii CCBAU 25509]